MADISKIQVPIGGVMTEFNIKGSGGSDGTEAKNFINNNLITSVNGTDVEFKFIYDSTQDKFGYRDASGTFVPFESGGDFSQLIYENLAAANIKSGTTISVKDPDGNLLNSATGSYAVNTFTNLTADNVKKSTVVTIKDTDNTTLKTVTGTYNGPESVAYLFHVVLATSGSGNYSYKTTRAYSWIMIASAGSDYGGKTATPSHSCGGTTSTTYGSSTANLYGSSVGLRLSLYKNVPNGSTISCFKTSGGPHCHYAIGIY